MSRNIEEHMPNWIYTPNHDNSARTLLGTEGERPLVCIGINPSTATPSALDRTVATVERVAMRGGFDSFMMLNVYPQRATDPNDLHANPDRDLHAWNLQSIADFVDGRSLSVWAAWGTLIRKRKFLPELLTEVATLQELANVRWLSRGRCSKAGDPHHPLYVKADAPLDEFDVRTHLASLVGRAIA